MCFCYVFVLERLKRIQAGVKELANSQAEEYTKKTNETKKKTNENSATDTEDEVPNRYREFVINGLGKQHWVNEY